MGFSLFTEIQGHEGLTGALSSRVPNILLGLALSSQTLCRPASTSTRTPDGTFRAVFPLQSTGLVSTWLS